MSPLKNLSASKRAQKVLFVGINYAPEPTGISPYTTGMAEGLATHGRLVRVLTSYPHYPWWRVPEEHTALPSRSVRNHVAVVRLRHYIPSRPTAVKRALFELSFGVRSVLARWGHPDVIVVVSPALLASRLVALRARLQGVPLVTWVQDIYTLGVAQAGNGGGAALLGAVERNLAQSSSRVVVIHDRFRRLLVEDLSVRRPVDVVRNWSHVPIVDSSRREDTRIQMGWKKDDIVVLHAGAMGAKQGLENVVHAARIATERNSRVRFVLLGDGNQRRALQALGADPRLEFVAPLPEDRFFEVLAAADVLLVNELPGLTEMSVPSKLTTYFATGLPVVAAVDALSTTHDEVQAAGAGPVISAGDPVALVDAVEALAADPARASEYGASGGRYRSRFLTAEAAIDSFAKSLDAAVG